MAQYPTLEVLHYGGSDSVVLADATTNDDVAEVFHCERHTVNQTVEQAAAIGKLFAAAPELLEALEAVCSAAAKRAAWGRNNVPAMRDEQAALSSARAAIAKATGAAE